jgi:hypothetical protein
MGRKKIDKTTLEYNLSKLFRPNEIIGFQYTFPGNVGTNKQIFVSLNSEGSGLCVIDGVKFAVEESIGNKTFPDLPNGNCSCWSKIVTEEQISSLLYQFSKLGYEVESSEMYGGYHWIRIKCTYDEIVYHCDNIKNNIKI